MATGATNAAYLFCFTRATFRVFWFPPTLWTAVNLSCIQSYIVATHCYLVFFLVDFFLPFDESCVVILSVCLSFSPSTTVFHLPTYHERTRWEVGACRTTRWTNWRVDRMTDMVRDFFMSPCRGYMFIFCLHVAMWIKTLFSEQWQKTFTLNFGGGGSIHSAVDVTLLLQTIVQREKTFCPYTARLFLQINKGSKAPTFNIPKI